MLLSEKIQRQLNLPATPFESHYKLLGDTGETLSTLGTVQLTYSWTKRYGLPQRS